MALILFCGVCQWVVLALLDNLFTIVSFPLAPLVAAFADKDGNLPRALR